MLDSEGECGITCISGGEMCIVGSSPWRSSDSKISEMTQSLGNLNFCGTGMIIISTVCIECISAIKGLGIGVDVVGTDGAELRVQSAEYPVDGAENLLRRALLVLSHSEPCI